MVGLFAGSGLVSFVDEAPVKKRKPGRPKKFILTGKVGTGEYYDSFKANMYQRTHKGSSLKGGINTYFNAKNIELVMQ